MNANNEVEDSPRPPVRAFVYKHGDRPLDGYVIQRGAGRGGFGEVYYALSDSGREVALKLVQTYEQIELRGISQCMNLKSPHLVSIFDVRYGNDSRPWVIMEFVNGPSLRQLLDEAPSGLGTQKAAFFLREIAKGLTYLHECGIVHRDLKPANIFYENGYVKIGDYGLSKVISTSQHSGQTVTVGTVHYMAPEIGAGNYDRGIDIYALGALLFEMLTGQVPFFGSSTAEVLMKHLGTNVDTTGIEEPFATVIRRALEKDPTKRYQSVQEMVEAIFGAEHVRNSVSCFSPDSLTMVAGYAAQNVSPSGSFTPSDTSEDKPKDPWDCDRWQGRFQGKMDRAEAKFNRAMDRAGRRIQNRLEFRFGGNRRQQDRGPRMVADPLRPLPRLVLIAMVVCMTGVAGGISSDHDAPAVAIYAMLSAAWGIGFVLFGVRWLAPHLIHESKWVKKITIGGLAGLGSLLFSMPAWNYHEFRAAGLGGFGGFIILDWLYRTDPNRRQRVTIGSLVIAALAGLVLSGMAGGGDMGFPIEAIVLAGAALGIALASPWRPRAGQAGAGAPVHFPVAPIANVPPVPQPADVKPAAAAVPRSLFQVAFSPRAPADVKPAAAVVPPAAMPVPNVHPVRRHGVPKAIRAIWLVLFVVAATTGLSMWMVLAADGRHGGRDEAAMMFGFGAGFMVFAALCLRRARRLHFGGIWDYLFRPMLQVLCLLTVSVSGAMLTNHALGRGDRAPAIVFIILASIVMLVVTFLTRRTVDTALNDGHPAEAMSVSRPRLQDSFTMTKLFVGFTRFTLTVAGSIVLLVALLVALAALTNLPGLFASGALDPEMPARIEQSFGTPNWPNILLCVGAALSFVLTSVAAILLLIPRRHLGALHMFRAVVAIGILYFSVVAISKGLPDWANVIRGSNPGSAIDMYLQMIHRPPLLWGCGLMLFGVFVMLWPANRGNRAKITYVNTKVEQPVIAPATAAQSPLA